MKKLLVVSYHFPPINNINARRFGGIVEHLTKFGWEPIVLTTKTSGDLPVAIPEEHIIRIGENYYSKKEGVTSEEGFEGIPALLKVPFFFYKRLGMEIGSIDRFILTWGKEVMKQKEAIRQTNPDMIIASCYPPVGIWVGRYLSHILKKPWVADLQDPLSLWNNSSFPFAYRVDRMIDKALVKTARGVIAISSHLAGQMHDLYKKPTTIIYNGFDIIKKSGSREEGEKKPATLEEHRRILYYAGRFYKHRMSAVKLLLDWIGRNREKNPRFIIRSLGPREANEELMQYAGTVGVMDSIEIREPASPETIIQEQKEADILLVFEDIEKQMRNSEGTMPGKFLEYLPFEAPIIAITRSDSEMGDILGNTKRGYLVSDDSELEEAMERVFSRTSLEPAEDVVQSYSREEQTKKLAEFLDRLC